MKNLWIKYTWWWLCVLTVFPIRAAEHKFRYYTDSEGLSSNTIQCFYQDSKGYIWVGTADGLNRFNSYDFTVYRSDYRRSKTLDNCCIYSLCDEGPSGTGRIWIGTSNGIYVFDPKDESFFRQPLLADGEELSNVLVYSMSADLVGNMWIGTLGAGLFRYNLKSGTTERYTAEKYPEAFSSNDITKVLLGYDNNIWIAANGGCLLNRYNPENNSFTAFRVEDTLTKEPISQVRRICQDSFGDMWIAGRSGELYKFELSRRTFTRNKLNGTLDYGRVWDMIEYAPGIILLGTDYGLVQFDAKNRSFSQADSGMTNRKGGLNDRFVHAILKDRDGGIWIGTYFGGINYLSPLSSLFSTIEMGRNCGRIISKLCEDADGNLWIGSDDGGLSRYEPRTGIYRTQTVDPAVPRLNIHALTIDDGNLWVGTYGDGLYCLELKTGRMKAHFTTEDTSIANLDVYSVLRDSRGTLWIGTKEGICCYDNQTDRIRCLLELGRNNDVLDIREDMRGNLWFASMGKGLIRYDSAERKFAFLSQNPDCEIPSFVSCLAVEGDNLWIGTMGGGLCHYDIADDKWIKDFDDTAYSNCAVFQIIQNGGELWMTTNCGVLKYRYGEKGTAIYRYTSEEGLLANIFNANSGIKASTGHIYIGCNNGINKFYPYDFMHRENSVRLNVVFSDFSLLNHTLSEKERNSVEKIDSHRKIKLRGRRVAFSLSFIALNFVSPSNTIYRYRLENFDSKWIVTDTEKNRGVQHVSYTNLQPATYRFVVSASDNGERFGEQSVLEIVVLPPWWMTGLMRFVYFVVFSLVAGWCVWHIRKRIIRMHREHAVSVLRKTEFDALKAKVDWFTQAAHEIYRIAESITTPVEEIISTGTERDALPADAELIRRNCSQLQKLANRIIRENPMEAVEVEPFPPPIRELETVDVCDLLSALIVTAKSGAHRTDVGINLFLPGHPVAADICCELFSRSVTLLISEALGLAKTHIDITLKNQADEADDTCFTVAVNVGSAIRPEALNPWLPVVRASVREAAGEIDVVSVDGCQTEFMLRFPLHSPHVKIQNEGLASQIPDKNDCDKVLFLSADDDAAGFFKRHLAPHFEIRKVLSDFEAQEVLRTEKIAAVVCNITAHSRELEQVVALCREIRQAEALNHVPIILILDNTSSAALVRGLQAGADVCLVKPISADLLDSQLRSLIGMRRQLRLFFSRNPYVIYDDSGITSESRFLSEVTRYIAENLSDSNLSVEDMAAALDVSRTLFFSRVKALAGTTPNELLRSTRLKAAAEMLAAPGGLRVTEICYKVGFTSTSYFAKCFQAQFGMLPGEFMERYRQE